MDIAIIGSGNLATNIGKAFLASGHNIIQVCSRTEDHARDLAQTLAASHTSCIDDISCDADVYVISVKDSAMGEVIEKMCIGRESKVFLHTAGSVGIDQQAAQFGAVGHRGSPPASSRVSPGARGTSRRGVPPCAGHAQTASTGPSLPSRWMSGPTKRRAP